MKGARKHRRVGAGKIRCRFCQLEMNDQSYPDHLRTKHPGEESNLLPAGHTPISSFFARPPPPHVGDRSRSRSPQRQNQYPSAGSQGMSHGDPFVEDPSNSSRGQPQIPPGQRGSQISQISHGEGVGDESIGATINAPRQGRSHEDQSNSPHGQPQLELDERTAQISQISHGEEERDESVEDNVVPDSSSPSESRETRSARTSPGPTLHSAQNVPLNEVDLNENDPSVLDNQEVADNARLTIETDEEIITDARNAQENNNEHDTNARNAQENNNEHVTNARNARGNEELADYRRSVALRLGSINKTVDNILEKIGVEKPLLQNIFDALDSKLKIINQYLTIDITVQKLEDSVKQLKKMTINEAPPQPQNVEIPSIDQLFINCKTLEEVCTKFAELNFDEDSDTITCLVCEEKFLNVTQKQLRYMKSSLKRHLKCSFTHAEAVRKNSARERVQEKEDSREKMVSMNLGRLVYFMGKRAKPDDDFPLLIDLMAKAKCDVGDINHSKAFPAKFIPHLALTVENHMKGHFGTRLKQTGKRPPAKILEDKATWKHLSRNVLGLLSVFPDSEKLIQAVYIGCPVCPKGDGESVRDNTVKETDKFIIGEQYMGGSVDGATLNLNIGPLVDEHYGRKGIWDHDPLHCAGLVDTHMRDDPKFDWLNDITDVISRTNSFFNIGKEFSHFFQVCEMLRNRQLDVTFLMPLFMNETRFANYVIRIYKMTHETYPALIIALEEVQEDLRQSGNSRDRDKAMKAADLSGSLFNLTFALRLSALCDIYNKFSQIVCVLQEVNVLPHEKFDKFKGLISHLDQMTEAVEIRCCPCSSFVEEDTYATEDDDDIDRKEVCLWPIYHQDIIQLKQNGEYRFTPMGQLTSDELPTRAGSQRTVQNRLLDQDGVVEKCDGDAKDVVSYLTSGLKSGVYKRADREVIEQVRFLLDLKEMGKFVKDMGAVQFANQNMRGFIEACEVIYPEILDEMEPSELRSQYRQFLRNVEELMDKNGSHEWSSMKIFQLMLETDGKRYIDCESVMDVMTRAAVAKSIESIIESWISVLEYHSNKRRPIKEERTHDEMQLAINGPLIPHCDAIVKKAMKSYWDQSRYLRTRAEGHFIRRSENIASYAVSKAVDTLRNEPPNFPFML